ncbi:MAG: metallophosphoesterase [Undibacterium sp.]|nr:metallophosphoesterase [Undibacterium sp.]
MTILSGEARIQFRLSMSLLALAFLCSCSSTPPTRSKDAALSSWVVMGENGAGVVRSLTSATQCPSLTQDGMTQKMTLRAAAEVAAQRKTASATEDTKPSVFPIMTCEAVLKTGVKTASIEGSVLPLPKATVNRIVVLGDTGCRMKKAENAYQACNDQAAWAFRDVSREAARFQPDLVIHVGDYHYRENPCPEGNAGCAGSPWGYGYDVWAADFFEPAAALLKAAPWVMVRGNHESCMRAGQGYWRFLDPRPYVKGRDCNLEQNDLQGDYSAPYGVMLGGDAQLIVFDSSKVPGKKLAKTDEAYVIYSAQFAEVDRITEAVDFNFFLNHHPILGFSAGHAKDGSIEFRSGNQPLQQVMQDGHGDRLFPVKVRAAISGHTHLFEAVSFTSDHPTQFVSGNGGTAMDKRLPDLRPQDATPFDAAHVDYFSNSNEVGFLVMDRKGEAWQVQAYDRLAHKIASCSVSRSTSLCQPNP